MKHRPLIVSWNVTGACHLRCPHCYLDARGRWPGEMTTQEGLRLIDQMAGAGTELLILTGGEPLLRKDLPLLAQHAAALGIAVVLGTTGTLITPQKARELKEHGVTAAGISIDSLDAAKHDAFRGVRGAWQRAVNGLDACREAGLDVLVHTTAMRMNQEEVPAIVQFAHEKGARAFHLFFLVCTGRGEQLTDLSPKEYETLLNSVLDAQEQYPGMMVRARCAPYVGRLAMERGAPLSWSAGCLAGTSYCRITPSGDVTPCPYLPTSVGNVREASFTEIWETAPLLARLRPPARQLGGKCDKCAYSQGDTPTCIGCRARALAMAGDDLAADPWCLYQPGSETVAPAVRPAAGSRTEEAGVGQGQMAWTQEAQERLGRVPFFIRSGVKQAAEAHARAEGLSEVTTQVLDILRHRAYGGGHPGNPSHPAPPTGNR